MNWRALSDRVASVLWRNDRNRIILGIFVIFAMVEYKKGLVQSLFDEGPVISPPPQVNNDGSVTYTIVSPRFRKVDQKLVLKRAETWVLRFKDLVSCKEPGEDGICRKWTFTVREPYFKVYKKGSTHLRFGLKYPDLLPHPDQMADGIPRFEPDYIKVSASNYIVSPPRYNPETGEHGGLGASAVDELKTVCRKDVEILPGLIRLREATQEERDHVESSEILRMRKHNYCLFQNKGKNTATKIIDRNGNMVMRIPPGALPAVQRYLYYGKDGRFLSAGDCNINRKTGEQEWCSFDLFLPPGKNISIDFNFALLGYFPTIHDGVIDFFTKSTTSVSWKEFN